jgi:hypothetical protein
LQIRPRFFEEHGGKEWQWFMHWTWWKSGKNSEISGKWSQGLEKYIKCYAITALTIICFTYGKAIPLQA